MTKKSFWSFVPGIFLLVIFSLLSACSDAEESVSEAKPASKPAPQQQTEINSAPKKVEGTLQDIDKRYVKLPSPQPTRTGDKIEVLEVFWYGCPHCYQFEPVIEKWLTEKADYIEFVRIPGVMAKHWLAHARAYYAAEKLGVLEKIHRPLFDAIHNQKKDIMDEKSLKNFFVEHGIDGDDFDQAYKSRDVEENVREAFQVGQRYQLTGVPAVIVNGKYGTSASMAGGYGELMNVIDILAADEYAKFSQAKINQAKLETE